MSNELIVVKQLPVIVQHLEALAAQIDEQVQDACSLACTAETVKDVKRVRAELNKQYNELEGLRKAAKKAIAQPYAEFEAIYKRCVSDKFGPADAQLKQKIGAVEGELLEAKTAKIKAYHEELCEALHVDCIPFKRLGLNVTLSASEKSLKAAVNQEVSRVASEVKAIMEGDHAAEVLTEYRKSLNMADAMTVVRRRLEEEEASRQRLAQEAERAAEEAKRVEAVNQAMEDYAPVVESVEPVEEPVKEPEVPPVAEKHDEKKHYARFTAIGTIDQLKRLKQFMESEGIKYEC